ncbi:MAG: GNAT family N-acetyltransferase [Neomegalonema sp.]|nr:GNAT family N-acetyltransferase [Neomegalonema sp.]
MSELLDRPVWTSLINAHRDLAEGAPRAKRYQRDVNLLAGLQDQSDQALDDLRSLVRPGEQIYVVQAAEIPIPQGMRLDYQEKCVQMIHCGAAPEPLNAAEVTPLADADAAEMLALATLTKPGPFAERTHTMGRFQGIRMGGRLVAMGGERMRAPGYIEISGVCTHPDFRGGGMARKLTQLGVRSILDRGATPFLHSWRSNETAIKLYQSLGFSIRTELNVSVLSLA